MSEKFTSLLAACAVTFAVFSATAPAMAKSQPIVVTAVPEDVPVRFVSYSDLNLARAADEKMLVRRVRSATYDVCTESVPDGTAVTSAFLACRTHAWRGASPQIERAVTRAREIAANGWSAIAPVAISISADFR
jgi:UrcA family protein